MDTHHHRHHHSDTTDLLDCKVLLPTTVTAACIVFCCYSYYSRNTQSTAKLLPLWKKRNIIAGMGDDCMPPPPAPTQKAVLPPGSLGWSFFGETVEFVSTSFSVRTESFMGKRRLKYNKVFRSHLFGSLTIVSTDADFSRVVLQSDASSFVPSYPRSLTDLMDESSILLINDALHRCVHGLVGAFLKSVRVRAQVAADVCRYTRQGMAGWEDGTVVPVLPLNFCQLFDVLHASLYPIAPRRDHLFSADASNAVNSGGTSCLLMRSTKMRQVM